MEVRLHSAGIKTVAALYNVSPKNMRKIWGNVQGERFWNMLKGNEVEEIPTQTNTIGHSHVLHPNWRAPHLAQHVLKRLVLKAASRLRRKKYFCKKIKIYVKIKSGLYAEDKEKFNKVNDSITLLEKSNLIWERIISQHNLKKIKQINVVLYELESFNSAQINFLEKLNYKFESLLKKRRNLSNTMDVINSRFGRDSITIGSLPKSINQFSGTKVAFTRIPDIKEFYE